MKVLVIGDSCTDIFIYGDILRISPEAPVPVIIPKNQTENKGMAGNVFENLCSLGVEADIVTNTNSIKKIRYVDEKSNQMVLRVDEHDHCLRITNILSINFNQYDSVIISDYCKGFLKEEDIEQISNVAESIVFLDTKKYLGDWCNKINYIKINSLEHHKNFESLPNYPQLKEKLIVTKGSQGCLYKDRIYSTQEVSVKDVSGAGDTFIAGLTVEYIKSKNIEKAINFAQECTTIVVQKHGVSTI